MSVIAFFRDWIGVSSGFDLIFIAIAGASGLIILDNTLRALFGMITTLFKRGRH